MKLICDGSLGGRTACLRQDYADAWGERGMPLFDQEELDDLVLTAHLSGMQTALHTISSRAPEIHEANIRDIRDAGMACLTVDEYLSGL